MRLVTRPPHRIRVWAAVLASVLVVVLLTSGLLIRYYVEGQAVPRLATAPPTHIPTTAPTPTPTRLPAEANPYPPYTGTLVWSDPLTDNSQEHGWFEGSDRYGDTCRFSGGAYQVVAAPNQINWCGAVASDGNHFTETFFNFTLQVKVTFLQGSSLQDQAGIIFRQVYDGGNSYNYTLLLSISGHYALMVCTNYGCLQPVFQGTCQSCHLGLSQSDTMGIVAIGSSLAFYVNGQLQASGTDARINQGIIGFYAGPDYSTTIMAYQDLKIWQQ